MKKITIFNIFLVLLILGMLDSTGSRGARLFGETIALIFIPFLFNAVISYGKFKILSLNEKIFLYLSPLAISYIYNYILIIEYKGDSPLQSLILVIFNYALILQATIMLSNKKSA